MSPQKTKTKAKHQLTNQPNQTNKEINPPQKKKIQKNQNHNTKKTKTLHFSFHKTHETTNIIPQKVCCTFKA